MFFRLSEVSDLFRRSGVEISLVLKGVDFHDDVRKGQEKARVAEGMFKAEDFHVAFPFLFFHEFQACFFRIRKPVCVIVSEILQEAILSV